MNSYKITTSTGYTTYLCNSQSPIEFKNNMLGFDYDKIKRDEWDKASGIIEGIELFYCDKRQKQVREILAGFDLDKIKESVVLMRKVHDLWVDGKIRHRSFRSCVNESLLKIEEQLKIK